VLLSGHKVNRFGISFPVWRVIKGHPGLVRRPFVNQGGTAGTFPSKELFEEWMEPGAVRIYKGVKNRAPAPNDDSPLDLQLLWGPGIVAAYVEPEVSVEDFTPDSGERIELHTNLQQIFDSRPARRRARVPQPRRRQGRDAGPKAPPHGLAADVHRPGVDPDDHCAGQRRRPQPGRPVGAPDLRADARGLRFDRSVVDIVNATDTVSLELVFTEDQTDVGLDLQQGLAAKQQAVGDAVAEFDAVLDAYTDPRTLSAGATLKTSATSYAAAAYASASTLTVDSSLGSELGAVGAALAGVEAAIVIDSLAAQSVAQSDDVLAGAEVLYAACLDLAAEVALETGGVTQYTVPGMTSAVVLAQARYGIRARSVLEHILTLDSIPDPTAIPAGTVLLLSP
jgi:hypothetical protein